MSRKALTFAVISSALLLFSTLPSTSAEISVNNWHCAIVWAGEYDAEPSGAVELDDSNSANARTNCRGSTSTVDHYSFGTLDNPRTYLAGLGYQPIWAEENLWLFGCLNHVGINNDCSNLLGTIHPGQVKYAPTAHAVELGGCLTPCETTVFIMATPDEPLPTETDCYTYTKSSGFPCGQTTVGVHAFSGASAASASILDPSGANTYLDTDGFSSFVILDEGSDDSLKIGGIPVSMDPGDSRMIGTNVRVTLEEESGIRTWHVYSVDGSDRVFVDPDGIIHELTY